MSLTPLGPEEGNPHLVHTYPLLLEKVIDGERAFSIPNSGHDEDESPFPGLTNRTLVFTFTRAHDGKILTQGFTRITGRDYLRGHDIGFLATQQGLRAWKEELEAHEPDKKQAIAALAKVLEDPALTAEIS